MEPGDSRGTSDREVEFAGAPYAAVGTRGQGAGAAHFQLTAESGQTRIREFVTAKLSLYGSDPAVNEPRAFFLTYISNQPLFASLTTKSYGGMIHVFRRDAYPDSDRIWALAMGAVSGQRHF
ncbi:hypothetical protein D3C81_1035650 [compost metagenome]